MYARILREDPTNMSWPQALALEELHTFRTETKSQELNPVWAPAAKSSFHEAIALVPPLCRKHCEPTCGVRGHKNQG